MIASAHLSIPLKTVGSLPDNVVYLALKESVLKVIQGKKQLQCSCRLKAVQKEAREV